ARAFAAHRRQGVFSEYPFGTDRTAEEIALARALRYLDAHTATPAARLATAAAAALRGNPAAQHTAALKRMGLDQPKSLKERLEQRLVVLGLDRSVARP